MANKSAVVQLALDLCQGKVNTEFASESKEEQFEVLRKALVEANGGSEKFDVRKMKRVPELFEIIEEILVVNDIQGFEENAFFERFVDPRNIAAGDENSFHVADNSLFMVNKTADGIMGVNRQRINAGTNEVVKTSFRTIKAYAELKRLLAGRINIVDFVDKIRKSFDNDKMNLIYETFYNGLSGLPAAFTETGTFAEDKLIDIVAHVEASTGQTALVVGTKKALSKVTSAVVSEQAKERANQMGHYGVFNGTDMLMIPQSHKAGTHEFAISDNDLWIVAGDAKPVKFVTEGTAIFDTGSAFDKADGTVELMAGEEYGAAVVLNQYHGQYRMA